MSAAVRYVEDRRGQFLQLISAYSEDNYAAGWMSGIEEDIRKIGGVWVFIAYACGGWPVGYEAEHGWWPLSPEELAIVAAAAPTGGEE